MRSVPLPLSLLWAGFLRIGPSNRQLIVESRTQIVRESVGVNWDDLRYLLALKRVGTLSAAAKELGVNHTTVSRRLQALEEELGTRLFERQPSGYLATPAGTDVAEVAERMEHELHALDRRVLGRDNRLVGTVRVTTVDFLAVRLASAVGEFTRRYPGLMVELAVENTTANLSKREADIAIRITNTPEDQLVGRRLFRAEFAPYAAESLIERMGGRTDLAAYPWVGWDLRMNARITEEWMNTNVPSASIVCRVDTSLSIFAAVEAGVGVAFLLCGEGERRANLRRVGPVEPSFAMDVWLLTHPDLRQTARVRAFMDYVAEVMREEHMPWYTAQRMKPQESAEEDSAARGADDGNEDDTSDTGPNGASS